GRGGGPPVVSARGAGGVAKRDHKFNGSLSWADPHQARHRRSRLSRGAVSGCRAQGPADFLLADVPASEGRGSRHGDRRAEGSDLMAERAHLDWFRKRIAASLPIEPTDPTPILEWLEKLRRSIQLKAELIALDRVRDWSRDAGGSIRHKSGQFFGIEGVRIESGSGLREVKSWDQPIFTQLDGGLLGLFARE